MGCALSHLLHDLGDMGSQLLPRLQPYRFSARSLPAADKKVDVLTYNVNFVTPAIRPAAVRVVQAIADSAADVVFLQETNALWQTNGALAKLIKERYPYQHWTQPPDAQRAGGSAVLS